MSLATIPDVLAALREGKPVIVVDDENRENEGDAILAAELASPQWIAWMVRNTSGFLCAPMTSARAAHLALPPMVVNNEDSLRTAYTITVDAASGITTGISAGDRARTLLTLADPQSTSASLIRPGHILPVVAVPGGVRQRPGHTEATVELLALAGLTPVGVIGEIVLDNGEMARLPDLIELGKRDGLLVTSISALIKWLDAHDKIDNTGVHEDLERDRKDLGVTTGTGTNHPKRLQFQVETTIPTVHGSFRVRAYHDLETGADHVAIISGEPAATDTLVRVHSECLTGEAFGSLKCECGPQLESALDQIAEVGGVVVYLRGHEGRGIGLINKLRAYRLQEDGLDTLDANLALDLPVDARDYSAAVAILQDLGISSIHLLTNNPDKVRQLEERGITVSKRVPLIAGIGSGNAGYLDAKRDRMGHLLPG